MCYERSSSPIPAWHKQKARFSYRSWDAWLREHGTFWFSPETPYFIKVTSILRTTATTKGFKLTCFRWFKKCVSKFLSNSTLYFQQTCCGWDVSPKRLWAERFPYSLHSEVGMFFDIYFMNPNQPPLKCGFRMCCEKSLWQCNAISPLLSFPFLLSLLLSHCTC